MEIIGIGIFLVLVLISVRLNTIIELLTRETNTVDAVSPFGFQPNDTYTGDDE